MIERSLPDGTTVLADRINYIEMDEEKVTIPPGEKRTVTGVKVHDAYEFLFVPSLPNHYLISMQNSNYVEFDLVPHTKS
tara:strand:+ start:1161 stop:1397 length:237 start_codon:yes stop_codon:yes gene_type:complete